MNKRNRRLEKLRQQIARTGDTMALHGVGNYTCCELRRKQVSYRHRQNYWNGIFSVGGSYGSCVESRNTMVGMPNWDSADAANGYFEQRMMMLAWFYEMVRSGEYDKNFNICH